jgi:hypothetical protein
MNGIKEELTRNWLIKAKRDLLSARQLAEGSVPLLDTAAYHCQQAAEKAIKAYLVYHDVRFEKTHDLDVLLSQAVEIDPVTPGNSSSPNLRSTAKLLPRRGGFTILSPFIFPKNAECRVLRSDPCPCCCPVHQTSSRACREGLKRRAGIEILRSG